MVPRGRLQAGVKGDQVCQPLVRVIVGYYSYNLCHVLGVLILDQSHFTWGCLLHVLICTYTCYIMVCLWGCIYMNLCMYLYATTRQLRGPTWLLTGISPCGIIMPIQWLGARALDSLLLGTHSFSVLCLVLACLGFLHSASPFLSTVKRFLPRHGVSKAL